MALIVKIGANLTSFEKEMKKLTKDVNKVGGKLQDIGGKLTAGITLPLAAIGGLAVKTGMDFESSMSQVAAISGATGDELSALEKKAREMGATTQFSATESADALSYMALAGWDTQEMINALPGVLDLAAAGALDLASASDIVTDMMSMYGMSADQASKASDIFAKAQSSSNTNVEQLSEALKMSGATANAAGMDLEQTSAILGVFANNGLKGSSAGTALDAMFRDLRNSVEDGAIAIGDSSVAVYDAEGNMRSMADIMADVEKATEDMDDATRDAALSSVFQTQALRGVNVLLGEGTDAIYDLEQGLYDADGAARDTAETMNDNLAGRLKEMKSAFEEVGIVIYENLQPALEKIVSFIKSLADGFNKLSPSTQTLIIGLAAIAAAIGPILMVVGTMIILFGKLSAACAILGISMAAAFWWVLAIIAALAAIVAVVVYWEQIKEFFVNLWEYLKSIFFAALEWLDDKTNGTFSKIVELIKKYLNMALDTVKIIWNWVKDLFKNALDFLKSLVKGDFQGMRDSISNILSSTREMISNVLSNIKNFFKNLIGDAVDIAISLFQNLRNKASENFEKLKNIIMKPVNWIRNSIADAFGNMKDTALGAWEGIKSGMKSAINFVIKMINKFIGGFNKPGKLLSKIPGVSVPEIPEIPLLATGGDVFGSGSAIVGEAGPELLQKSGSSVKVTPLSSQEKAGGIGGAMGGGTYEFNVSIPLDGETIAKKTVRFTSRELEKMRVGRRRSLGTT
ncbi:phage tail tape measure protein [Evansella cellulosilytica]|uniref:Phage tail tape measure protein, TP901 family n=1 Tax=Evansella cellulosilytica (strain ATCC 21833 / DSM 2522 / FERM P-1141 / JCM 9156 / N-4) TaxID=649639 RepID=E6U1K4_EVAC2|nr:phage tail tape measure protein [Evansella cellulosilytica]ADU30367.1 phage tail tape measure protein, TP901 family [Evansella cellulosilytica DSM 2522]